MESFLIVLILIVPFLFLLTGLLLDLPSKRKRRAIKTYFAQHGEINIRVKQSSAVCFQDKVFLKKLDEMLTFRLEPVNSITGGYGFYNICRYFSVILESGKVIEVVIVKYNLPFSRLNIYLDGEI